MCKANFGDHAMTDFSAFASWRSTKFTHREYLSCMSSMKKYTPSISLLPGFISSFTLPNLMHTADLGTSQSTIGNIWAEIFSSLHGTAAEKDAHFTFLIKTVSHLLGVPVPLKDFTEEMCIKGGQPQRKTKAAETRYMVPVTIKVLVQFFPIYSVHDALRFRCLQALRFVGKRISYV